MTLVVLALAILAGAVALAAPRLRRDRRLAELDRFHRAAEMTGDWSRAGVTRPLLVDDAAVDGDVVGGRDAAAGAEDRSRGHAPVRR